MIAYHRTHLGNVVTSNADPDRDGYVATTSVLTGRYYGRLRASALRPATPIEIQRAEAECLELARSAEPPYDCEMARARAAARKRLGLS